MYNNVNKIEALLESDDELPSDYDEEPSTPAYQIPSRFDSIQFNWINNRTACKNNLTEHVNSESNDIKSCVLTTPFFLNKPIIKKGVLLKSDLICLQAIQSLTGDSTLIWLINFLLLKDLQTQYTFLKSCLVGKLGEKNISSVNTYTSIKNKIVIKSV